MSTNPRIIYTVQSPPVVMNPAIGRQIRELNEAIDAAVGIVDEDGGSATVIKWDYSGLTGSTQAPGSISAVVTIRRNKVIEVQHF